ncbi:MAG: tRNA lysidine(34) synthetase TilS [Henriciella sp.]|nr:tRNA lysidine(34) synthetase TilS [Henriciella sp.]
MTLALGPEFDQLVQRFSDDVKAPLAVAVSGGSDSTALLYLTADWAARAGRKLLVLTVDHQLRTASAAEARSVGDLAATLGVQHRTLLWQEPQAGQSAARDARHRLLARAARDAGALILLLGHTLDDVIETIHIRERRSTPEDRLAGPVLAAPSPVWPEGRGLTLLRPLIATRRQVLRDWLSAENRPWIDDPSNENQAYERIEVREALKRERGEDARRVEETLQLMARRQEADIGLGEWLDRADIVTVDPFGLVRLALDRVPPQLAERLVGVMVRVCGGHDRTPRAEPVKALLEMLKGPGDRATLGGAWFQRTRDGVLIGRDPGAVHAVEAGGLWDGRFAEAADGHVAHEDAPFLVRHAMPPGPGWRQILSERIALEARIYQTPLVNPVHT